MKVDHSLMKLNISEDFSLPMNVVTKRLAFLGTTGSGKSYAAMKLAEELLMHGVQTIIIDPVGIHWGLRLSADGKSAGIPINVFGGLYGDVPITATSGAMIADVIIDKKISAVIDVSQFEYDTDKAKFTSAFAQRFFFRKKAKPSPVMIFLEEAQEFIPQNPERDENIMLHHFIRMCKIGRNFGIGISIISQRPQEVNKKALNLSQCVFAFQTSGHHERKAIDDWVRDKGLDLDIAADLPKLPVGQPHLWSPGWLGVSQKVKISKRITFHPSEEETISYEPEKLNKLSPVDIAKLSESIKETIEKAKELDPETLKKRIRDLEKNILQLEKQKPVAVAATNDERLKTEIGELKIEIKKGYETNKNLISKIKHIQSILKVTRPKIIESLQKLFTDLELFGDAEIEIKEPYKYEIKFLDKNDREIKPTGNFKETVSRNQTLPILKPRSESDHSSHLSLCAYRIMEFLAVKPYKAFSKTQIGGMTGYSPNGGSFNNSISELNTKGLIEKNGSSIKLSGAGAEYLMMHNINPGEGEFSPQIWLEKLPAASKKIFEVLLENPSIEYSKPELGELTGYEHNGGSFNNAISKLCVLGLAERIRSNIRLNKELSQEF